MGNPGGSSTVQSNIPPEKKIASVQKVKEGGTDARDRPLVFLATSLFFYSQILIPQRVPTIESKRNSDNTCLQYAERST